jgi:hypothetical protein
MEFAQVRDRVETSAGAMESIDLSALSGVWVNSNPSTNGIARMVMHESDGNLLLQVYAIGTEGLIDWGQGAVDVFTSSASSRTVAGFTCRYDFGFAETRLQAMFAKGLMVLAQFHTFNDESGRVDYFVREYFALNHGRY